MMEFKSKIVNVFKNPLWIVVYLNNMGFHCFSDKLYLKVLFKINLGYKLNLSNPKTFNEKMQWLKLYDRKDIYTLMVDKYEAKRYVKEIIGDEYIIPTIGVYDSFDEMDFEKLPDQFVIKCTHDSGGNVIVKNKKNIDRKKIKKKINKCLKRNYYYVHREWPYKNVKPRIIVEKYLEDNKHNSMRDYKFFCFNGIPKIMYISEGLENHLTASMSFYDMNFELLDCKRSDYKQLKGKIEKPKNFEKMKVFAANLSKQIPHVRVDFYEVNGQLFFGELTFYTCSGYIPFSSKKWDLILGNQIELPNDKES